MGTGQKLRAVGITPSGATPWFTGLAPGYHLRIGQAGSVHATARASIQSAMEAVSEGAHGYSAWMNPRARLPRSKRVWIDHACVNKL